MTWQKEPTEPGFYWAREKRTGKMSPVWIECFIWPGSSKPDPYPVNCIDYEGGIAIDEFDLWFKIEPPPLPV